MKTSVEKGIDETKDMVFFGKVLDVNSKVKLEVGELDTVIEHRAFEEVSSIVEEHFLTNAYEKVVNIFGRFQQESIALGLSELR